MAKVCAKCGIEKDDEQFRIRIDKRVLKPSGLVYRNNRCLKCESEINSERSKNERKTDEGKAKHNKWAKEFHKRHRDKCLDKMKEYRATPEYKEYMKEYRLKNKEKIKNQEKLTKKKYSEKNRDSITDKYVARVLRANGDNRSIEEILKDQSLIEIHRSKILISRIKGKLRDKEIGVSKKCTVCFLEKDLSRFIPIKRKRKDGTVLETYTSQCRDCNSINCKKRKK